MFCSDNIKKLCQGNGRHKNIAASIFMWALFDIIRFSAGSIFWGVLIAMVCMALFVLIIKGWWKNAVFTVATYAVGAVLFVLLSIQCILICGSIRIMNTAGYYEQQITGIVNSIYDSADMIYVEQSSGIIDSLTDKYPILNNYIGGGEFSGYSAAELPHAMADELRSFMKKYIVRRLLWCLGFVLVGGVIAVKTITVENRLGHRSARPVRSRAPMSGSGSRPHVRRRR